MYVDSLTVKNLRCFKFAEIKLHHSGRKDSTTEDLALPNINLLLGVNGSGKTTALKALALAALSPVITQSGYVPYHLVRSTNPSDRKHKSAEIIANVVLHPQDESGHSGRKIAMKTTVSRIGDTERIHAPGKLNRAILESMYLGRSPSFLVVGYGATRRIDDFGLFDETARERRRLVRYQRVAGLFESEVSLRALSTWLPQFKEQNPGRYKQVVKLIDELMPEGARFSGQTAKNQYLFAISNTKIPFGALSDGYRAYIGWIADLLYHLCMGAPTGAKLKDNFGVVLVDEIDLHLHPEWQRTVVSTVAKALPNLQFVFTTHSPIVAGSLHKENVFVMEETSNGSRITQFKDRIYGLDAEQVLISPYFNLQTTRAPGFVNELQELSKKLTRGRPEIALEIMQRLSGKDFAEENKSAPDPVAKKNQGRPSSRTRKK